MRQQGLTWFLGAVSYLLHFYLISLSISHNQQPCSCHLLTISWEPDYPRGSATLLIRSRFLRVQGHTSYTIRTFPACKGTLLIRSRFSRVQGHISYTFAFFPCSRTLNPFSETNKTYEVVRDTLKTQKNQPTSQLTKQPQTNDVEAARVEHVSPQI